MFWRAVLGRRRQSFSHLRNLIKNSTGLALSKHQDVDLADKTGIFCNEGRPFESFESLSSNGANVRRPLRDRDEAS